MNKYTTNLYKVSKVGDRSHFSIATTPRCSGGRNSFLWIAPLYP